MRLNVDMQRSKPSSGDVEIDTYCRTTAWLAFSPRAWLWTRFSTIDSTHGPGHCGAPRVQQLLAFPTANPDQCCPTQASSKFTLPSTQPSSTCASPSLQSTSPRSTTFSSFLPGSRMLNFTVAIWPFLAGPPDPATRSSYANPLDSFVAAATAPRGFARDGKASQAFADAANAAGRNGL